MKKTCFFFQGQILIPPRPLPFTPGNFLNRTTLICKISTDLNVVFVQGISKLNAEWRGDRTPLKRRQSAADKMNLIIIHKQSNHEQWLFSRFILSYLDIYPFITAFNHIQPKIIKALCLKVLSENTAGKA